MKVNVSWREGERFCQRFVVRLSAEAGETILYGDREMEFTLQSADKAIVQVRLLQKTWFGRNFCCLPLQCIMEDREIGIIEGPDEYQIRGKLCKFSAAGHDYESKGKQLTSEFADYVWKLSSLVITPRFSEDAYFFAAFGAYLLIRESNR